MEWKKHGHDQSRSQTNESELKKKSAIYQGLTSQQLVDAYRIMFTSRRIDDREILLKRQQKIFFQISGAGHEAVGVAAGFALKARYDWFYPYYRDRALCLALGATPYEMLLRGVGAADDPSSGGRQMPSHWAFQTLNVVTQSSPTGTQILQAVGCAEAGRYFSQHPEAAARQPRATTANSRMFEFHGDEVTYVSLGDGTTSEGEFWEALNTASNKPLARHLLRSGQRVRDLGPGRSTDRGRQHLAPGLRIPQLPFRGNRRHAIRSLPMPRFKRAADHCRAGNGPAFVHAHVIRPYSHSLSDDERLYRPEAERQRDAARDPVPRLQMFLLREGILDEKGINKIETEVEEEIQAAADRALEAAFAAAGIDLQLRLLARSRPHFGAFDTQSRVRHARSRRLMASAPPPPRPRPWPT